MKNECLHDKCAELERVYEEMHLATKSSMPMAWYFLFEYSQKLKAEIRELEEK